MFADQIYLKGLKEGEIAYFKLSKDIFPFDKEIIVAEALTFIRNKIVNEKVNLSLKEALKYDPYSAEMLGMYVQYANHFGNKKEANSSFVLLKKISPNSNAVKELSKRF